MTRVLQKFVLAAAFAALLVHGQALAGSGKVVVELFTSQGCSSCPPADRLLGELAKRDDVIALSFHVDYWNYLGWTDPFSSAEATNRQRSYRAQFGLRYIYTPQMVMGGSQQAVGSSRGKVLRGIEKARNLPQTRIDIAHNKDGSAVVEIGAGAASRGGATVWLFAYDRKHSTAIRRGENEGVKLENSNVVRAIRKIGRWNGRPVKIRLPLAMMGLEKQDGCAIVVQSESNGLIYGAADFALMRKGS